ncbi:MAG: DUF4197 domain-containing protein [Bacteroidetes bacterium]|nr:MAG: DUF4197 domain-containing protein [Bacteroidota bacterium]
MKKITFVLTTCLCMGLFACDTLYQLANTAGASLEPSTLDMIQGLKEALGKGTEFAVNTLSAENGYFNDPLVRIPFPQEAEFAAKALRDIGLGSLVDEFEKLLNRGAEEGAKMALPIFTSAIKEMTINDAKNILLGGERAATDYFEQKTRAHLYQAFAPHIQNSLDRVNATKLWQDITTRYNAIPFTRQKIETDLVKYATEKALDGLFIKVAEEEKKIREDPLARSSELLRKVFGYADSQK